MRFFRHWPYALMSLAALHALFASVAITSVRAQEKQIDYAALRDEAVRAMSEYLQINTTNPPGNELATAKWLQAFLAKEGIEGEILDTAELGKGRANFYARLKGDGSRKAIALVHHMDVVPANADEEVEGTGAVTFTRLHPDLLKDVEFLTPKARERTSRREW